MVYASSVPSYLDPPPNWNQQQQQQQQLQQQQHQQQQRQLHHQQQQQQLQHQQQAQHHQQAGTGIGASIAATGGGVADPHLHHQPLPPLPDAGANTGGAAGGSSSARSGSMADRARQAKLPIPEQALRCPRCDSTNTKFCYFNNYSLSQPRHFCKTCRRYWTRGGALRNVPVGGGCRRNKRSKGSSGAGSSSSKSTATGTSAASGVLLAAAAAAAGGSGGAGAMGGSLSGAIQLQSHHMPFLGSLQSLDYGAGASTNIGLNYGGIHSGIEPVLDYQQVGSSSGSGLSSLEQWRQQFQHAQQFPLFGGVLEPAPSVPSTLGLLTPFDAAQGMGDPGAPAALILNSSGRIHSKASAVSASAGLITQLASVKMEENSRQQGLGSLARQYLGININPAASGSTTNEQYWLGGGDDGCSTGGGNGGGSAWTNLSGFNSSSTGNL